MVRFEARYIMKLRWSFLSCHKRIRFGMRSLIFSLSESLTLWDMKIILLQGDIPKSRGLYGGPEVAYLLSPQDASPRLCTGCKHCVQV